MGTFSLQHTDPDYSAAYVILETDVKDGLSGYGITFTLGRGTEVAGFDPRTPAIKDCRGFCLLTTVGYGYLNYNDSDPRTLLSRIDFRYITNVLTEEEAYEILQKGQIGKKEREDQVLTHGYPAYTTSCAWPGYSDEMLKQMMDANQRWDVPEAVEWMSKLAEFKPLWVEEPTSPADILGHATIAKAFVPLGIGVAMGEQFLFAPMLVELACELVQHLIIFDFVSVSASLTNRMCEYVNHLHEHFKYPVIIKNASYMPPKETGYSTEMKEESVKKYQYPDGEVWKKLLAAQGNLSVQPSHPFFF